VLIRFGQDLLRPVDKRFKFGQLDVRYDRARLSFNADYRTQLFAYYEHLHPAERPVSNRLSALAAEHHIAWSRRPSSARAS
jgi:hypothetical protein